MWPESNRALRAIWHFVGIASENETSKLGLSPFFSNVHTPLGPLNNFKLKISINKCVE